MIINVPFLRTTLHFGQIFLILDLTFIKFQVFLLTHSTSLCLDRLGICPELVEGLRVNPEAIRRIELFFPTDYPAP